MAETKTKETAAAKEVKAVEPKVEAKTAEPKAKKATKTSKDELMEKYLQMVQFVQNTVGNIENDLKRVSIVLSQLSKFNPEKPESFLEIDKDAKDFFGETELKTYSEENMEVVEGKFDGYFMIGADQKKYPVPLNYSSKTKLIPGDVLKLKILEDGKFIYKLIQPADRKHVRAILSKTEDNKFIAMTDDGKSFFLNQAAVSFFKGKPGDELYILVNEKDDSAFAAIEAIIKK
ncbi:50S ribosomal protein L7/L12 [candidate division SR1 bacterium RAAC1_SR1_1]|nr:50S ribosomal protein L7/L12 [candidate division SR1 bacterium RAAC1_SR1_1]